MKRWLLLALFAVGLAGGLCAQSADTTQVLASQANAWDGHYYCEKYKLHLYLSLDRATLVAPGFEAFGTVSGYMSGGIYGTWFLVRHEADGKRLRLRMTNDLGSYTQLIVLTPEDNGEFSYEATGGNEVRRAEGRKLVRIESRLRFVRK